MGNKSGSKRVGKERKGLSADLHDLVGTLDNAPDDPVAASLLNIRVALRIIQFERQTLYNNGLHLTFQPTMSGGLTVSMSVL